MLPSLSISVLRLTELRVLITQVLSSMAPYEDEEANWIEAVTATYFRVEEKMRHQHIGDFSTICVHAQQQPSLPVMYPKDTSEI